jgi:hypothetical protein
MGTQGIGGLNRSAAGPPALVLSSGASSAVPMISAALAVPILVRVPFIVVSFQNGGPTWSVVLILGHAGNAGRILAVSRWYRAC